MFSSGRHVSFDDIRSFCGGMAVLPLPGLQGARTYPRAIQGQGHGRLHEDIRTHGKHLELTSAPKIKIGQIMEIFKQYMLILYEVLDCMSSVEFGSNYDMSFKETFLESYISMFDPTSNIPIPNNTLFRPGTLSVYHLTTISFLQHY